MVIEFFDVILKLLARGNLFTWIYSVLLSAAVVMATALKQGIRNPETETKTETEYGIKYQ